MTTPSFGALTPFHAKLLAHELSLRKPSDSVEKLATALADAQVDLNPHQVDAALSAFQSPFSKGAPLPSKRGESKAPGANGRTSSRGSTMFSDVNICSRAAACCDYLPPPWDLCDGR